MHLVHLRAVARALAQAQPLAMLILARGGQRRPSGPERQPGDVARASAVARAVDVERNVRRRGVHHPRRV